MLQARKQPLTHTHTHTHTKMSTLYWLSKPQTDFIIHHVKVLSDFKYKIK